ARRVFYTTKIFNYDSEQEDLKNTDAQGYSGFSVTHPINTQDANAMRLILEILIHVMLFVMRRGEPLRQEQTAHHAVFHSRCY
ncbi:hypothetical protein, partial [Vallitalea maricola]|uniref:hypothetical protein n=1 Tax=Vallitalea maricola TaxID=3074433 RepID=UPI0030D9CDE2